MPVYTESENVYVDLSQTSCLNDRTTWQAVDYLVAGRCLFGTDGPCGAHGDDDLFDYLFIKRRIEKLFLEKSIQKRALGENFLELAHR